MNFGGASNNTEKAAMLEKLVASLYNLIQSMTMEDQWWLDDHPMMLDPKKASISTNHEFW